MPSPLQDCSGPAVRPAGLGSAHDPEPSTFRASMLPPSGPPMTLKLARKLLKELKALGVQDARLVIRSGHPRLLGSANGKQRFYVVPSTEGDWRSELNARAGMKRVFEIARKRVTPRPDVTSPSPARRPKPPKPKRAPSPPAPVAEAPVDRFHAPLAIYRQSLSDRSGGALLPTPDPKAARGPRASTAPGAKQVLRAPFLGLRRQFIQKS